MADSKDRRARRVNGWWIVLVIALGLLAFALTGITQGVCYDSSDPAASYCTSGPVVPAVTVPYFWGGYVLLARG